MISLLQLQYFLAMAEEGHLTRTAEKLFVSQSTLSSMISKLENELGVELFDRKNNRMILNKCGERYRKHIAAALNEIETGARAIKNLADGGENKLSIAVSNARIWHELLWEFKNQYPDIHMQIHADKMEQYGGYLAENKIDFIIAGYGDFDDRQCDSMLISEKRLCLSVAPEHHLADSDGVYLKDIQDEPYIELSPGLPYRNFCDKVFEATGVKMNTVIECNYEMRPRLVLGGYGVAITTDGARLKDIFKGTVFVPIKDEMAVRKVGLFWNREREFSPVMQVFYDYMLPRKKPHPSE